MDGDQVRSRRLRLEGLILSVCLVALALPAAALAAFPGGRGKIAYAGASGVQVVNEDGTGNVVLAADGGDPAWSPDGSRIAFTTARDGNTEIYVMNADGSAQTRVTNNPAPDFAPEWEPHGARLVFTSQRDGGNREIYTINPDGSGETRVTNTSSFENHPVWSPLGDKIAFDDGGGIYTINVDGTGRTLVPSTNLHSNDECGGLFDYSVDWLSGRLVFIHYENGGCDGFETYEVRTINPDGSGEMNNFEDYGADGAIWSPDATRFAMTAGGSGVYIRNTAGTFLTSSLTEPACCPDWQPIVAKPPGYARPRGATPINVTLVPAYRSCTSPNMQHGPPLAVGSCNPAQPASSYLTVGTFDANGAGPNSSGVITLKSVCNPPAPNPTPLCTSAGDQADVSLTASLTDVRNKSDLTDYTGELRVQAALRVTDKLNNDGYGITSGTAIDTPFGFTMTCLPTSSTTVGSTCSAATYADAIMSGIALEDKRAIWQLGQVQVYDGGSDGDADTTGDNTLFMTQGLFAP